MLEIVIPDKNDLYNEVTDEFLPPIKGAKLQLEHSLISLHDWEARWHKPFLGKNEKTYDEIIDYIRCMTIAPKNVDQRIYQYIPKKEFKRIIDYINDPMTATWFSDHTNMLGPKNRRETVTAEIIYYWMVTSGIPYECRKWHLNQLLTLIKVISLKNAPEKKMSSQEAAAYRAAQNKARRAKYNSKG